MTGRRANDPIPLVAVRLTVEDFLEIGPAADGTDIEYQLTYRSHGGGIGRLRCLGTTVITSVEHTDR